VPGLLGGDTYLLILDSFKLISVFSKHLDQVVWAYLKETKTTYMNMPQTNSTTFEIVICLINGRKYEFSLVDAYDREAAERIILEIKAGVPWALVGRYDRDLNEVFKENPHLFRHKYGRDPNEASEA
jgi:hypothetical protein